MFSDNLLTTKVHLDIVFNYVNIGHNGHIRVIPLQYSKTFK